MATRKNNQERSKSGSLRVDPSSLARAEYRPIWACAAVVLRVTCSPRRNWQRPGLHLALQAVEAGSSPPLHVKWIP